jgi:hypothetical protein
MHRPVGQNRVPGGGDEDGYWQLFEKEASLQHALFKT